jgi:hypothetical protein
VQLTAEDAAAALARLCIVTPPKSLEVVRPTVRHLFHCLERNEASLSLHSTIIALDACIALDFASAPVLLRLVGHLGALADAQQLAPADLCSVADAMSRMHAAVISLPDTPKRRRHRAAQAHVSSLFLDQNYNDQDEVTAACTGSDVATSLAGEKRSTPRLLQNCFICIAK